MPVGNNLIVSEVSTNLIYYIVISLKQSLPNAHA